MATQIVLTARRGKGALTHHVGTKLQNTEKKKTRKSVGGGRLKSAPGFKVAQGARGTRRQGEKIVMTRQISAVVIWAKKIRKTAQAKKP